MFEINKYSYIDKKTRSKFAVFARTQEFADKIIERVNKLDKLVLRPKRFGFCRRMATDLEPYRIEQEQEETVKGWEVNANAKKS